MKVAMNELAKLYAGRTYSAGITVTLAAEQIIGKSHCYCKLTVASRTCNEQGMRKTVVIDTAAQLLNDTLLTYDILEENTHQYMAFAISYTLSKALRV